MDRFVLWLYRMQQRLRITRAEGLALLTVCAVCAVGLLAQAMRRDVAAPPPVEPPQVRSFTHLDSSPGANRPSRSVVPVPDPARPDSTPPDALEPAGPSHPAQVDLNTASIPELQRLPGIGPVLAERITRYRSDHGPFLRVDDLQRIRGIGTKTLATVRPLVAVRQMPRTSNE